MQSYTIRSHLAMGACAISGTLSVLFLVESSFHDGLTVRLLVPLAVSAGLVSLAIITGVLAHGHGVTLSGAALAVLAAGLSLGIVWEQSGRRAQTQITTQTTGADAAKERARLTKLRAEADEILATHRAAQAKECASGKGKRCDGITYTVRTWEAAREGYDAKLRGVPVPVPNAKIESVGTVAGLTGHNVESARTWATLLDPIAIPMLLELAAILCGIVAFGPKHSTGLAHVTPSTVPASSRSDFPGFPAKKPQESTLSAGIEAPANETVECQKSETRVVHSVSLLEIADDVLVPIVRMRGGEVGSQAHLAKLSKLSEATISKMLARSNQLERVWDHQSKCNVIRLKG